MYDLSNIMKKAWQMYRENDITFSEALKIVWRNVKAIVKARMDAKAEEETHTWYNWTLLGKEVIHDSKCLFQVVVEDLKTRSGYRTLSYFGMSQVCELGSQNEK